MAPAASAAASSTSQATSQSSARRTASAERTRAAGASQASAGSIRRTPSRPARRNAQARNAAMTIGALTPIALPTTRTSNSTPPKSATRRIRRVAAGMHDSGLRSGLAAPWRRGTGGSCCARPGPVATWHDPDMTDQEARYDRIAEGYSACWSPIHRDRTLALLDVIEPFVAEGATRAPRRGLRDRRLRRRRRRALAAGADDGRRPVVGDAARGRPRARAAAGRACATASTSSRPPPTGCRSMTARSTS